MATKNLANPVDELRSEYDFATLTGRVQGKHYDRATAGTTLVLLEPDVARAFPSGRAVNRALRMFLKSRVGKLPNKRLQPTAARGSAKRTSRRRGWAAGVRLLTEHLNRSDDDGILAACQSSRSFSAS